MNNARRGVRVRRQGSVKTSNYGDEADANGAGRNGAEQNAEEASATCLKIGSVHDVEREGQGESLGG